MICRSNYRYIFHGCVIVSEFYMHYTYLIIGCVAGVNIITVVIAGLALAR